MLDSCTKQQEHVRLSKGGMTVKLCLSCAEQTKKRKTFLVKVQLLMLILLTLILSLVTVVSMPVLLTGELVEMQLIAKCETRQSLFNFKAIAQEADAVMLSRGNLGLDVLPEKMALVQKHVIQQCNMLGKPVIVTRVVDTMVTSPRPTRYGRLSGLLLV